MDLRGYRLFHCTVGPYEPTAVFVHVWTKYSLIVQKYMFEFWKTTCTCIRCALLPNHGTQGLHKELELDTTHIIPYIHRRTQNNSKNKKENLWQSSG